MSGPDYIVIRAAPGLPPWFLPTSMDGRWYDRADMPEGPPAGTPLPEGVIGSQAVAVPTGRFEVRDYDGAVAEVWEARPVENPAREATNRLAENLRGVAGSVNEQIAAVRREIDKQVIADHPNLGGDSGSGR